MPGLSWLTCQGTKAQDLQLMCASVYRIRTGALLPDSPCTSTCRMQLWPGSEARAKSLGQKPGAEAWGRSLGQKPGAEALQQHDSLRCSGHPCCKQDQSTTAQNQGIGRADRAMSKGIAEANRAENKDIGRGSQSTAQGHWKG